MTRTLSLIGGNGDNIPLGPAPFRVYDETVILGSTEEETRFRDTIRGRRTNGQRPLSLRSELQVFIDTATVTEARDAMRRLAAALSGDVWLIVDHGDSAPVAMVGQSQIPPSSYLRAPDTNHFALPVEIEAVDDPYWITIEPTIETVSIGVSDSTPWTGWTPTDSPAVLTDQVGFPTNGYFIKDASAQEIRPTPDDRGVDVWPEWTITGPLTGLEIANLRTGKVLAWETPDLAAGDELRIVTDPNNVSVELNGDDAYFDLELRSELFPLRPGENPILLTLTGGTTGQSSIGLLWHERRRSP